MDSNRKKFIEINKRIFNHRDGEIQRMQKDYGSNYPKSLGVPVIYLEQIATDFERNHDLAKMFWEFGGREQTLMAAMLEDVNKVRLSELEVYLINTHTPELWEQITRQLLRKLSYSEELIYKWLDSDSNILNTYAILNLSYNTTIFDHKILEKVSRLKVKEGSYLYKCINRVFLKIGISSWDNFMLMKNCDVISTNYSELIDEICNFHQ